MIARNSISGSNQSRTFIMLRADIPRNKEIKMGLMDFIKGELLEIHRLAG